jgi:pyruvate dehydrogenase E2 component (dihydrolipoamide acetyltransferase)|tara:strand:+ start:2110 stop:3264 length:1155 start_codon:yes stop_codon:yes gene_type:complete
MIHKVKISHICTDDEYVELGEWKVKEYDFVRKGDILCLIEASKVTVEILSDYEGYVLEMAAEGSFIKDNDFICIISDSIGDEVFDDIKKIEREGAKLKATKKALKLANEYNVDLNRISAVGVIKERDIIEYLKKEEIGLINKGSEDEYEMPELTKKLGVRIKSIEKFSSFQLSLSRRVSESFHSNAKSDFVIEVKIDNLLKHIDSIMRNTNMIVSISDSLIKITAETLQVLPIFNSFYYKDSIVYYDEINIGFTVDLENKLIVPVIKDVLNLSALEVVKRANLLKMKALKNQIDLSELRSGTFTITSLEKSGISFFTPIINKHQSAILGIGAQRDSFNLFGDKVVKGKVLFLCLSIDHRFANGTAAAKFLGLLKEKIENCSIVD